MHRIRLFVAAPRRRPPAGRPRRPGASSGVVVSQVYAGGGNSGASFTHDFVELFNRGSSAVDLDGWTIQYASAAGTTWQTTDPRRLDPARAATTSSSSTRPRPSARRCPTPDAIGTSNLAVSGGKVALVSARHRAHLRRLGRMLLGELARRRPRSATGRPTDYEGSGAAPGAVQHDGGVRDGAGCTDTDVNSADFTAMPRRRATPSTPAATCLQRPAAGGERLRRLPRVDVDIQPVLSARARAADASASARAAAGDTPAAISERVTVVSNNETGYALTVHRSAFTPGRPAARHLRARRRRGAHARRRR